ncbi:MAG: hybrid sensor histidine kinase/response regulator [Gammaproteobacteria bacterium]|nr:hybrid sensor histidine kinase/response regulator [Gammaproteobacteria bacterium]
MIQSDARTVEHLIEIEALDKLFGSIRKQVLTNHIVPAVVLLVMWTVVDRDFLLAWGVLMFIGIWANYFIARSYLQQPAPVTEPKKWGRRMSAVMLYFGLLWVYAIFLFHIEGSVGHQVFLSTIAIVFSLGSVMVGLYWFPMFYLLAVPVLTALIIRLAMEGSVEYISLSILVLWTLVMSGVMARMLNKTVRSEMRLRYESSALAEELHLKTVESERANIAKSKFLDSASHDLRQPLHALMLNTTILLERNHHEQDIRVIDNIIRSVHSLEGLFGSLLDISKLDAGVVTANNFNFRLQEVFDRLKVDCQVYADEKKLTLDIPSTELCLFSDPVLVERVLRNIISNAIRYTDSGHVGVIAELNDDAVILTVIDTGVGIKSEEIKQIFDEFVQLENAERDRAKGLGLGLSIVKRLCKILGCAIQIESSPGKGSEFSFALPCGDGELVTDSLYQDQKYIPKLLNYFVVVIDDEKNIRDSLKSLLESWQCTVLSFASEEQAVKKLSEYEYPPDVLLVDYRLGKNKTGIEAISAVNKLFGKEIPVLIVTADTASESLKEVEISGYPLLHKPVRPSQLRLFLQKLPVDK